MIYCQEPVEARFIRRVNRFLCRVLINGREAEAHVPNSGRLKELLTPNRNVILSASGDPGRKTSHTLRSVRFNNRWVCVDSTVANGVAAEMAKKKWPPLFEGYGEVKREHAVGRHRFDLLLTGERGSLLVEVKSVTLVEGGVARFPDAPTTRGSAHMRALAQLSREGGRCAVLFVSQRSDSAAFQPNTRTDPDFTEALWEARSSGVEIMAVRCTVGGRSISPLAELPVELG